jgi:phospholipase C
VRVPMLIVSPFSRGGRIHSVTLDHTSQLRLLEERFGIKFDNISAWRRKTVGSLTHTFFHHKTNDAPPVLPATAIGTATPTGECLNEDIEAGGAAPVVPMNQRMPTQHGTTVAANRYFKATPAKSETMPLRSGRSTSTKKSAGNALAEGREVVLPTAATKH